MSNLARQPKLAFPSLLACVPPAGMEETAWDILLILYADEHRELSLTQLSVLASVRKSNLETWLGDLEDGAFITGAAHSRTGELIATLTAAGRALLDRYLSATTELHDGARQ